LDDEVVGWGEDKTGSIAMGRWRAMGWERRVSGE